MSSHYKKFIQQEMNFEVKTAAYLPNNFNCSNDDATIDDRSGEKRS